MINLYKYKYINTSLKLIVGILAISFVVYKINKTLPQIINSFQEYNFVYSFFLLAVLLVFFNWLIEAFKLKVTLNQFEDFSIYKAYGATLAGISSGVFTPNRVGEIIGRALYLSKDNRIKTTYFTFISSISQLLCTILFGCIAFIIMYIKNIYILIPTIAALVISILFVYSNIPAILKTVSSIIPKTFKKRIAIDSHPSKDVLYVNILLSTLRYVIFIAQFLLLLKAFNLHISHYILLSIPLYFLLATVIPSNFFTEIGIRGSVAIIVFSVANQHIIALLAMMLWMLNVALPAIIGVFFINNISFVKSK